MLLCVIFCPQFCCVFAIMHMNLFRDGTGGNVVKELSDFKKLKYFLTLADELMRTLMIPIGLTPTSI